MPLYHNEATPISSAKFTVPYASKGNKRPQPSYWLDSTTTEDKIISPKSQRHRSANSPRERGEMLRAGTFGLGLSMTPVPVGDSFDLSP